MNLLGCLDTPDEGRHLLEGEDVAEMTERRLAEIRNQKIGFIFQGFNLVQNSMRLRMLRCHYCTEAWPGKRNGLAQDALEAVGLGKRMWHYPNQMSGGQQQRVAIARAVAAQPEIILG